MKKYEYSVLQYFPSIVSGERINIGILVYCSENNEAEFIHIKGSDYKRLQAFDDEVNNETIKMVLSLIYDDIKEISNPSILNLEKKFDICNYTKYFCNEYRFAPVVSMNYENIDEAKEELKNIYF